MGREKAIGRVTALTVRLIANDLRRIQAYRTPDGDLPPPGFFSTDLTRYLNALMNQKRTTEKIEDEMRAALKKLPKSKLLELAGLAKGNPNDKKSISDAKVQKGTSDLGEEAGEGRVEDP